MENEIITDKNYVYKMDASNPRWRKNVFHAYLQLKEIGNLGDLDSYQRWLENSNITEAEMQAILVEFGNK